jgi:hypothetical protein
VTLRNASIPPTPLIVSSDVAWLASVDQLLAALWRPRAGTGPVAAQREIRWSR